VNPVKRKHVSEPSYLLYSFYHLLNTNYLYDVLYSYDYIVQCFSLIPVLELVTFILDLTAAGVEDLAQWKSTCLACVRHWI
jgi:hypothetical protein